MTVHSKVLDIDTILFGKIVLIKNGRISTHGGKSINIGKNAVMIVNPDYSEISELVTRMRLLNSLISGEEDLKIIPLTTERVKLSEQKKFTLIQLVGMRVTENFGYFTTIAKILNMSEDYYYGCPNRECNNVKIKFTDSGLPYCEIEPLMVILLIDYF